MTHSAIAFAYRLTGHGWAEAVFSDGKQRLAMRVSYLSDPLADLTRAVLALLQGSAREEVLFLNEPGEHRCLLQKREDGSLLVRVRRSEEWWGAQPTDKGLTVFSSSAPLVDFARQIEKALGSIIAAHGADGYKEEWVLHEFPCEEYVQLQMHLALHDTLSPTQMVLMRSMGSTVRPA